MFERINGSIIEWLKRKKHPIFEHNIYIYAVGGESWPPQGGDLVPSTLPAAEPSILARQKLEIYVAQTKGFFAPGSPESGDQIPSPAVSPENALRNSNRNFSETTIFIVFSCFFDPVFGDGPKTRKTIMQRVLLSEIVFEGAIFVQIPFFLSNFYLAPLAHSDLRTVLKPLFL